MMEEKLIEYLFNKPDGAMQTAILIYLLITTHRLMNKVSYLTGKMEVMLGRREKDDDTEGRT